MARKSRTVSWASDLDTVIKCPGGDPPLFEGTNVSRLVFASWEFVRFVVEGELAFEALELALVCYTSG